MQFADGSGEGERYWMKLRLLFDFRLTEDLPCLVCSCRNPDDGVSILRWVYPSRVFEYVT